MSQRIVIDQSNYVPVPGLLLTREDIVDRDGYRDTTSIVNEFLIAGERLRDFRKEEFDFVEGDELTFDELGPKKNGFDIIDAAGQLATLKAKYVKAQKEIADKKVAAATASSNTNVSGASAAENSK